MFFEEVEKPKKIEKIKNIKYKKSIFNSSKMMNATIQKINRLIDIFDQKNKDLFDSALQKQIEWRNKFQKEISDKYPGLDSIMLRIQSEFVAAMSEKITSMEKERISRFESLLKSWTNNPKLTLKEINKQSESWHENIEKYFKLQLESLDFMFSLEFKKYTEKLSNKTEMNEFVSKKLECVHKELNNWRQTLEKWCQDHLGHKMYIRVKDIITILKTICDVCIQRKGSVLPKSLDTIREISAVTTGGSIRSESSGNTIFKILRDSNDYTNKTILSLIGLFTDGLTKDKPLIENYIKMKLSK